MGDDVTAIFYLMEQVRIGVDYITLLANIPKNKLLPKVCYGVANFPLSLGTIA